MSFWVLCLLCIVQGLTEFLPISSSGHLTFIQQVFGVKGNLSETDEFLKAKYADGSLEKLAEKYTVGLNTEALK